MPVKADAYGHGAVAIAETALAEGAECLAVARTQEGAELRRAGITAPILLLSQAVPEELDLLTACGLTPLISDTEFAGALNACAEKAGRVLSGHIKIDTGMGRIGCRPEDAPNLARYIASLKNLRYEGTATHLACADDPAETARKFTETQLERFRKALDAVQRAGFDPGVRHAANSGAVLLRRDAYFDMIRPGILLYGYPPSPALAGIADVEPVMTLETEVVFIKTVKKGETVSYGGTWTAPADTVIATLPVGYGDGLFRGLSGRHQVIIEGKSYPLVGRICMDQCTADLGPDAPVKRWTQATVFADAADAAAKLRTIPYEITCAVSKRVPRIYCSE
jgi:alanine racemase